MSNQKEFEEDDPMELNGVEIGGIAPEIQTKMVIEEFVSLNYSQNQIKALFTDPFYFMCFDLKQKLGEEKIMTLINEYFVKSTSAHSDTLTI